MLVKLDYYYGNEAEQYTFYRIPKALFTDEHYANLSLEAKVLYRLRPGVYAPQYQRHRQHPRLSPCRPIQRPNHHLSVLRLPGKP